MQNARLDEAQTGIRITRRNVNTSVMQLKPPLWQKPLFHMPLSDEKQWTKEWPQTKFFCFHPQPHPMQSQKVSTKAALW